jgi:beta-lactamase regulating signal transducer with metallopeptidase domain
MGISDLFYIVIFLSIVGSTACVLLLLIEKVVRLALPFFLYATIAVFYVVPLVMPITRLSVYDPMRIEAFDTAALVWIIGFGTAVLVKFVRILAASRTIKKYADCKDERILTLYGECVGKVKLIHSPPLLFGAIKEPACVITILRSYVILHGEIIKELTDDELRAVLIHELLHIKRKHTIMQMIFDLICCVHWFNPIIWIGRYEFLSACEIDCDRSVLKLFDGEMQAVSYAKVMVRLMELTAAKKKSTRGTGVLDFWVAKHRITNLLNTPSKLRKTLAVLACALIICGTIWMSAEVSRSYFYPYNSAITDIEWSALE